MKFKISTSRMSYILAKVAYGVSKKYTNPITEYLFIDLNQGDLLVRSTNGVNFVSVIEAIESDSFGFCVVKAETLIKLVEKTTKPELSFSLKDTYLEVKGNGTHKVPTIVEAFPTYEFDWTVPQIEIATDVLKRAFKVNESAIAKELIMPCLTGYNVGDNVVTTDGIKMCLNATQISDERILVTQTLADLISKTITADKASIQKDENKLLITSDNITIFGTELDGLDEYPNIEGVMSYEFVNAVTLGKSELLAILDRLLLFVDPFESDGIYLSFLEDRVDIEDMKKNSLESMEYMAKEVDGEQRLLLSISLFKDILSAVHGDTVTLQFDPDIPTVRIDNDPVTFFLGTMAKPQEQVEADGES